MITLRPAAERGHADLGWLKTAHSFSFADYHDPAHVHFGPLRVINDDQIAAGAGFGMHGHRDMEIITYVTRGRLAHEDSMGNRETIGPGEIQRMSAGRGVMHSEFNHERDQPTELLQIWILPNRASVEPSYAQALYPDHDKRGRLKLVVSPDGRDASLSMHADAQVYAGLFDGAEAAVHPIAPGRLVYLHVARGTVVVNGRTLSKGDALKFVSEPLVEIREGVDADVLLFDLPPLN
jgi:quercetin 2,3-dioxygenase